MLPTAQQARQELARRELQRRGRTDLLTGRDEPQDFAARHPLASNPIFSAVISRPAAATRSAIRGVIHGKNPIEEYRAGAVSEGDELVERAKPFSIPKPSWAETFLTPGGLMKRAGSELVEMGVNTLTNPAEALAAIAGFKPAVKTAGAVAEGVVGGAEAVGRGVGKAASTVSRIPSRIDEAMTLGSPETWLRPARARNLMFSKIRQRLLQTPKLIDQEFESSLNTVRHLHPTQMVDATEEVLKAQGYMSNPHFATVLETTLRQTPMTEVQRGVVRNILQTSQAAANLGLDQAQLLKRVFGQSLKSRWRQIDPEYLGAHLDMQELYHGIRLKEIASYPELKDIFAAYNKAMDAFRLVKTALKENNIEQALMSNFNSKGLVMEEFKKLASLDTIAMITRLYRATKLRQGLGALGLKAAQGAAGAAGVGAVGYPLAKFLMGER